MILRILILASITSLIGCKEHHEAVEQQNDEAKAVASIERYVHKLEPLINPAKLDALAGKRAATPRIRKACYWLEMALRDGTDPAGGFFVEVDRGKAGARQRQVC
mgnify:CR=1 FL=1